LDKNFKIFLATAPLPLPSYFPDHFIAMLNFFFSQSQDDAKGIAAQMNASDVFIITVDYHDPSGLATDILSKVSTPYMNFSSEDQGALDDVRTGLCYGKMPVMLSKNLRLSSSFHFKLFI
jgi:hypothetical protein